VLKSGQENSQQSQLNPHYAPTQPPRHIQAHAQNKSWRERVSNSQREPESQWGNSEQRQSTNAHEQLISKLKTK